MGSSPQQEEFGACTAHMHLFERHDQCNSVWKQQAAGGIRHGRSVHCKWPQNNWVSLLAVWAAGRV